VYLFKFGFSVLDYLLIVDIAHQMRSHDFKFRRILEVMFGNVMMENLCKTNVGFLFLALSTFWSLTATAATTGL